MFTFSVGFAYVETLYLKLEPKGPAFGRFGILWLKFSYYLTAKFFKASVLNLDK